MSQASPGLGNKAIEKDNYCFKAGNKPQSVATPDLSAFPPDIQYLFKRAFIDSRDNPENRPSADEWYKALLDYKKNLVQCKRDATHFYYVNDRECPYCAAEERYNLSLGKSSGSQMTFSQPISVPGTSSGTSYGNSTYVPSQVHLRALEKICHLMLVQVNKIYHLHIRQTAVLLRNLLAGLSQWDCC